MKLPDFLKPWKNLIRVCLLLVFVLVSLYLVRFFFWLLAPFFLAWLFSLFMRPLINLFDRRLRLGRSLHVVLAMFLTMGIGLFAVYYFFNRLYFRLKHLSLDFPAYAEQIGEQANLALSRVRELTYGLSPNLAVILEQGVKDLGGNLAALVNQGLQYVVQLSFSLPEAMIIIIVAVVAAYFYSIEYERIDAGLARLLPMPWRIHARHALVETGSALKGLLRAQLILFGIAFLQLLLGFWLLGIDNWFAAALLVTLVDILPIVGTGFVLIPWMVWSLLLGKVLLGLGLLVLYLFVLLIRNLLTPKLYAQSFGMDTLSTLIAMYVGLKLVGFWGLFLAPLLLMVYLIFYQRLVNREIP